MSTEPAHTIDIGTEKGGSANTTTAMNGLVGLLGRGHGVASIDVDIRQGTLSRYLANRQAFIKASIKTGESNIEMPSHYTVKPQERPGGDGEADDAARVKLLIEGAIVNHDVVVIDTPGSANSLSVLAHSYADTLITPINDSFVDLDVLVHVDGRRMAVMGPSHYAEMVWEQKKVKAARDGGSIDWLVLRNRLSSLDAHNKRKMDAVLKDLSQRIGVRIVAGLGERVIFRELFLAGLTIMDLKDVMGSQALGPSHLAARQEINDLIDAIEIPATPRAVAES